MRRTARFKKYVPVILPANSSGWKRGIRRGNGAILEPVPAICLTCGRPGIPCGQLVRLLLSFQYLPARANRVCLSIKLTP